MLNYVDNEMYSLRVYNNKEYSNAHIKHKKVKSAAANPKYAYAILNRFLSAADNGISLFQASSL